MKKITLLATLLLLSGVMYSQVGINTNQPNATLDVTASPDDLTKFDGIIPPRLTGEQLRAKTYTADQTGAMVYATEADSAPAGQTIKVTTPGFYYFDGMIWQKAGNDNDSVTADNGLTSTDNNIQLGGTLLHKTTVTMEDNQMAFEGDHQTTTMSVYSGLLQEGVASSPYDGRGSISVYGADKDGDGDRTALALQAFADNGVTIFAYEQADALSIGTDKTKTAAHLSFYTSEGGEFDGTEKARITSTGEMGIGTTMPTEKLDNNGILRVRQLPLNGAANAINTKPDGNASGSQDQTFTASRTVVADENGVLGYVDGLAQTSEDINIYKDDGTLTNNRTVNVPSGQWLNFAGASGYIGIGGVDPIAKLNVEGFIQFAGDSDYGVGKVYNDPIGEKYGLTQSTYFPESGAARSSGTRIYTSGAPSSLAGHISFGNYSAPDEYNEWGRFAHKTGNFGINTITGTDTGSNNPTEKLDVNGNVRIRTLPLNGATSAIYTQPGGGASNSQDQTFTASRTVVADENGVLGYTIGLPGNDINFYKDDGTLTNNRTVTQDGHKLNFIGQGQKTIFNNNSGTGIMQDSGSGTRASIGLSNGGTTSLWIYTDTNSAAQIIASYNSTRLSIGTNATTNPAPISFVTSEGGGANATQKAEIAGDGRFNIVNTLSIGYGGQQNFSGTERLKVNGSIVTAGSTYPDYVFQDYFNGISTLNNSYKFTNIYDAEQFIKENNHLPGVTSVNALEKTDDGNYMINLSDLSVQSLEKIEELYLYTIEQQKQIDKQQEQIKELLDLTQSLKTELDSLKTNNSK